MRVCVYVSHRGFTGMPRLSNFSMQTNTLDIWVCTVQGTLQTTMRRRSTQGLQLTRTSAVQWCGNSYRSVRSHAGTAQARPWASGLQHGRPAEGPKYPPPPLPSGDGPAWRGRTGTKSPMQGRGKEKASPPSLPVTLTCCQSYTHVGLMQHTPPGRSSHPPGYTHHHQQHILCLITNRMLRASHFTQPRDPHYEGRMWTWVYEIQLLCSINAWQLPETTCVWQSE